MHVATDTRYVCTSISVWCLTQAAMSPLMWDHDNLYVCSRHFYLVFHLTSSTNARVLAYSTRSCLSYEYTEQCTNNVHVKQLINSTTRLISTHKYNYHCTTIIVLSAIIIWCLIATARLQDSSTALLCCYCSQRRQARLHPQERSVPVSRTSTEILVLYCRGFLVRIQSSTEDNHVDI